MGSSFHECGHSTRQLLDDLSTVLTVYVLNCFLEPQRLTWSQIPIFHTSSASLDIHIEPLQAPLERVPNSFSKRDKSSETEKKRYTHARAKLQKWPTTYIYHK